MPGLVKKIHPYYGTYFPTRFDHLVLFEDWLKSYTGEKKTAIDVGIGCGVLTYLTIKNGFKKVYGTDSNPNAIIGLEKVVSKRVHLFHGDLFADVNEQVDMIVFNPPWLPETQNTAGLDSAIYYPEDLFSRFFEEAHRRLSPTGKLVIIFSNLAQITNVTKSHAIEDELKNNSRFVKDSFLQKNVKAASVLTKRNQNWRDEEKVELWVLNPEG